MNSVSIDIPEEDLTDNKPEIYNKPSITWRNHFKISHFVSIFDFTIALLCLSLQIDWFFCDSIPHYEVYCTIQVNNAIATLKAKLSPYLIAITPAERQAVPKMSDGTIPFVEKAMDYAREDAQFLPPYTDLDEVHKDWNAVQALVPMLRDIKQIESNLSDTVMVAGSEAYLGALSYYNSVKNATKWNVADAKIIYEDLKQRFQKSRTSGETEG